MEIDVSKCHFYYKCDYFNCSGYKGVCTSHPDCYYKQLQQLKAENEELKEKLEQCLDEIFENIEYIEATAERIDDDNYIALACRIAETSRNILQLIKQAKEVKE